MDQYAQHALLNINKLLECVEYTPNFLAVALRGTDNKVLNLTFYAEDFRLQVGGMFKIKFVQTGRQRGVLLEED